jgi:hypothetical protein
MAAAGCLFLVIVGRLWQILHGAAYPVMRYHKISYLRQECKMGWNFVPCSAYTTVGIQVFRQIMI